MLEKILKCLPFWEILEVNLLSNDKTVHLNVHDIGIKKLKAGTEGQTALLL